jgi:hypothetical protein
VYANQTYAVGDIVIMGVWARAANGFLGDNDLFQFTLADGGFHIQDISGFGNNLYGVLGQQPFLLGDGEWQWIYRCMKITAIGTNPVVLQFGGVVFTTQALQYFAPVYLHIPTGTISDNEAAYVGLYAKNYSYKALVGEISCMEGHTVNVNRYRTALGTAYSGADAAIVISGGWGSTAAVSAASGYDQAFSFVVSSSGSGIAATPTITITFKDGTWAVAPQVQVTRNDTAAPTPATFYPTWTVSATQIVITMAGTPTTANAYKFSITAMGV